MTVIPRSRVILQTGQTAELVNAITRSYSLSLRSRSPIVQFQSPPKSHTTTYPTQEPAASISHADNALKTCHYLHPFNAAGRHTPQKTRGRSQDVQPFAFLEGFDLQFSSTPRLLPCLLLSAQEGTLALGHHTLVHRYGDPAMLSHLREAYDSRSVWQKVAPYSRPRTPT